MCGLWLGWTEGKVDTLTRYLRCTLNVSNVFLKAYKVDHNCGCAECVVCVKALNALETSNQSGIIFGNLLVTFGWFYTIDLM